VVCSPSRGPRCTIGVSSRAAPFGVGLHRGGGTPQHLRGTAGQLRTGVETLAARAGEGQVDDARLLLRGQHARHHRLLGGGGRRRRCLPQ